MTITPIVYAKQKYYLQLKLNNIYTGITNYPPSPPSPAPAPAAAAPWSHMVMVVVIVALVRIALGRLCTLLRSSSSQSCTSSCMSSWSLWSRCGCRCDCSHHCGRGHAHPCHGRPCPRRIIVRVRRLGCPHCRG